MQSWILLTHNSLIILQHSSVDTQSRSKGKSSYAACQLPKIKWICFYCFRDYLVPLLLELSSLHIVSSSQSCFSCSIFSRVFQPTSISFLRRAMSSLCYRIHEKSQGVVRKGSLQKIPFFYPLLPCLHVAYPGLYPARSFALIPPSAGFCIWTNPSPSLQTSFMNDPYAKIKIR